MQAGEKTILLCFEWYAIVLPSELSFFFFFFFLGGGGGGLGDPAI